jgi:hypothetical protein
MAKKIVSVTVTLDDNVPEYMAGIIRCGSVVSEDEDGKERGHEELVDNAEFHSEKELISHVANRLGVNPSIIRIE